MPFSSRILEGLLQKQTEPKKQNVFYSTDFPDNQT